MYMYVYVYVYNMYIKCTCVIPAPSNPKVGLSEVGTAKPTSLLIHNEPPRFNNTELASTIQSQPYLYIQTLVCLANLGGSLL